MFSFIKQLLSKPAEKGDSVPKRSYQEQTAAMTSDDLSERLTLAGDKQTSKEVLYYLAEKDPDPEVRKAVINNRAMPVHASMVLAQDAEPDVRMALAKRLVSLLPDLSEDKQSQLYAYVVQALGTLALDEVLKIRVALSSTLKDHAHTPPKVAGQLARDVEREVSEPILRFCSALSDEDLLDILKSHPSSWAIEAIASRPEVNEPVSEAVIETNDVPGGKALISNEGAQIGPELLTRIVEKARKYPEWQKPMATRQALPVSIARELAEFVDASVRDVLMNREDFDDHATEEIAAVFRRRMDFASEDEETGESYETRLDRLEAEGNLNEETLSDALAMREKDFVVAAMARMMRVSEEKVVKVFNMRAPKAITAMAWHAGLSMRMALQLQKEMGKVPPKELIYPREGTDYPLDEEELAWQVDFLELKAPRKGSKRKRS